MLSTTTDLDFGIKTGIVSLHTNLNNILYETVNKTLQCRAIKSCMAYIFMSNLKDIKKTYKTNEKKANYYSVLNS